MDGRDSKILAGPVLLYPVALQTFYFESSSESLP